LINEFIDRFKLNTDIAGVCLHGSRAAGYARIDSDYDVVVVLENYSHIIKYLYKNLRGKRISPLMVDRQSIEKNCKILVPR
jgi:predicted nucleotidyltransferase